MNNIDKKIKEVVLRIRDENTNTLYLGHMGSVGKQTIDEIKEIILSEVLKVIPKEKEIMYEELDTGIGIDRLEYDGQDDKQGFNQCRKQCIERVEKLLK